MESPAGPVEVSVRVENGRAVNMMGSINYKHLIGKAIISHTIGGLCAGVAAHGIFVLVSSLFRSYCKNYPLHHNRNAHAVEIQVFQSTQLSDL